MRFRTQDLGVLDPAPCSCGVKFPRLHIRGRIVDQVQAASAEEPPVSPYLIEEVLYSQPAVGANYQAYYATGTPLPRSQNHR